MEPIRSVTTGLLADWPIISRVFTAHMNVPLRSLILFAASCKHRSPKRVAHERHSDQHRRRQLYSHAQWDDGDYYLGAVPSRVTSRRGTAGHCTRSARAFVRLEESRFAGLAVRSQEQSWHVPD